MNGKRISLTKTIALIAMAVASPASAGAGDAGSPDPEALKSVHGTQRPYSPYARRSFPSRPLFGDTRLHTSFSFDAGAFGARLTPSDAYRFARGEEVTSSTGQPAKLSRPLDFLVVADHSDGVGLFPMIVDGDPLVMGDPQGRRWNEMLNSGRGAEAAVELIMNFGTGTISKAFMPTPGTPAFRAVWAQTVEAAEDANDPGHFTAFVGFEWSSNTDGNNLHRNVIYRDGADKAIHGKPFTTIKPLGSDDPADLWKWMAAYEEKTGGQVLAIAHNGNLSNGRMFPMVEAFGRKLDREYVETREKWERLYEVTQMKGTGETHPVLSPTDEFANFEIWDKGNLDGSAVKTPDMLPQEYARSALKNGLVLQRKFGANPYRFGMVGSTDAHTALSAAEEENFFGKVSSAEPGPRRLVNTFFSNPKTGLKTMDWEVSSAGYAAVWAAENTREALFDAMQRRETYATTGTRMMVRFFGSFDFEASDANSRNPAFAGYAKGVPMGGELRAAPAGKAPGFLVAALKDPIGANLDRYQVVKGWVDAKGEVHEKVYDVAWSGQREPGADGKLGAVGSTVDVPNATWTNTIGATELIAVWQDPDFDPQQAAFYYGRVLEIPTPRWTAYDAKHYGIEPPPGATMTLQERAYTSPIWYTPVE